MFILIHEIADFSIFPVEDIVDELESTIGIVNDGFILTENFKEFELDSTDLSRNLQIIILVIIGLLILPIVSLLLWCLLSWSTRCKRWLTKAGRVIFWNTYIRFGLESYLELAIVSFLRLKKLSFGSASAIFNSCLSLVLLITLGFLLPGSIPVLHCKNMKEATLKKSRKFSALTMGL